VQLRAAPRAKDPDFDAEIVAQDGKVTLRINGKLMCEVDDRDSKLASPKGIIALHSARSAEMVPSAVSCLRTARS
jgi:hypothetical protein